MLKGEIAILADIALSRCTYKQITSRRTARSSSYVSATVESLVRLGYLTNSKPKGYQLTEKGALVLLECLSDNTILENPVLYRLMHEHLAKAKGAAELIETLGIEYDKKVRDFKPDISHFIHGAL